MMNILFILLITTTGALGLGEMPEYQHIIWEDGAGIVDKEIIDEWSTTIQRSDSLSLCKSHYKAILFSTPGALDRYLKKYPVEKETILIDVKMGKVFIISQKAVEKTVTESKQVIDHYEWERKE